MSYYDDFWKRSSMKDVSNLLCMKFEHQEPTVLHATVTIEKPYIESIYQEALLNQKKHVQVPGFSRGSTPLTYLEKTYKIPVLEHLKEFFFSSCVSNFLSYQLSHNKIVTIGKPRLIDLALEPQTGASFKFQLTKASLQIIHDWDRLPFKAPGRKNYRDLDKQVEVFLAEEEQNKQHLSSADIQIDDWICFTIQPINAQHQPLLGDYGDMLWLKIGDEEADEEVRELFLHKKLGDTFITQAHFLQEHTSKSFDSQYNFIVAIIEHCSHKNFCIESFKKHFKLKTAKELHLKLIEVFSFRHDLSQRRETVEAVLKTLLRSNPVAIPQELIYEQREQLLKVIHLNPDYYVYKTQPDFNEKIFLLAEKQLKEYALIDALAYKENISVTRDDIISYLNLMKRPRIKEFVYFDLPSTNIDGQEQLISHETLRQHCLREKTLNYALHKLTKNR